MLLDRLDLHDFRSYDDGELIPAPAGITLITGSNGAGKTNLIEAVAYLATLRSMRGAPVEAMVRTGATAAVLRALVLQGERGRRVTVDVELTATGRGRAQVQGQPLRRQRDLLGALRVTVFSPDDLVLVKGGPAERRTYLDDLLVALDPAQDRLLGELDRILRQRNALLRSLPSTGWRPGRPLADDVRVTLDVWDAKLDQTGSEVVAARTSVVDRLAPLLGGAYRELAGEAGPDRTAVEARYVASFGPSLRDALAGARDDDLRRGVTTVGPHRDDVSLSIGALPARTHASQGEQRTLALALRLAGHRLVTETLGEAPILLLDDVFSELDASRAAGLVAGLPPGQALLTTATEPPPAVADRLAAHFRVEDRKILA